ncbi:hypothetical protein C8R45DRAFT_1114492 [Mycena sanguinolenta]|nr:hypothetical protein C8R45DRAFT_1114492 [Mycena sanguinolenta]
MALLGEMHLIPSSTSWFNLPRAQGVSYAAQESWVLNDTIKNDIVFNTPMHIQRYKKVLYQYCLERDLELFDAGDETEVGEQGLTLSGGIIVIVLRDSGRDLFVGDHEIRIHIA